MKIVLVLSAVLGVLLAQASGSVVDDVEEVITFIESIATTGDSSLGIGVLDPADVGDHSYSVSASGVTLAGTFSNVELTGVSDMDVTSVTESDGNVVVSFTIPTLTATGDYTAKGKIKESIIKMTVKKSGTFTFALTGVTGTMTLAASESSGALSVSSVDVDYEYSGLSLSLSGFNSVVKKLIVKLIKKYEKSYRSDLETLLAKGALELCEEYLSKVQAAASGTSVSKHQLVSALRKYAANMDKHPIQSLSWRKL